MKFVKVTGNCHYSVTEVDEIGNETSGKWETSSEDMTQTEIIPVENLLKIYRRLPEDYILVYVFKDPSTGSVREFHERFMSGYLLRCKMEYLERYLCGKESIHE